MCLAVPALVIEINNLDGKVNIGGVIRDVRFDLVENIGIGDYVLLHAGYAIEVISETETLNSLKILEEL